MNNFAILDYSQLLLANGIQIVSVTNTPCHLTLYWTDIPPRRHHRARIVRGLEVPWGTYFCFVAWHAVPQNETGDTLTHTFDLSPWPTCETRWFTFRGTISGIDSPSVGPIIKKHHQRITRYLILRPNATGDLDRPLASYPNLYPDNWPNVDEVIPDEDLTYVYITTGFYWDLYNLPNHTTETGLITSVEVVFRCRTYANPGIAGAAIKIGGVGYRPAGHSLTTSYVNYSHKFYTNPNTGVAWTWADIDALQAGVRLSSSTSGTKRCTQIYVIVEYQESVE